MKLQWHMRRAQARHGDDWLMTYADTITLLFCLFVALLAVEGSKLAAAPATPPPPPIAQPRTAAQVLIAEWPRIAAPAMAQTIDSGTEDSPAPVAADPPTPPAPATLPVIATLVSATPVTADPPAPPIPATLPAIATLVSIAPVAADPPDAPGPVRPTPAPPPQVAPQLVSPPDLGLRSQPQGAARLEQTGDRITRFEFSNIALFGSGSATLTSQGRTILLDVVAKLSLKRYRDYRVTIEGHTDDAPISTLQFPSNWELSTARADAVVRFLIDQGVLGRNLHAAGYADTHPVAPNRDASGAAIPANQARNRRVVIELEKIETGASGPAEARAADRMQE